MTFESASLYQDSDSHWLPNVFKFIPNTDVKQKSPNSTLLSAAR